MDFPSPKTNWLPLLLICNLQRAETNAEPLASYLVVTSLPFEGKLLICGEGENSFPSQKGECVSLLQVSLILISPSAD